MVPRLTFCWAQRHATILRDRGESSYYHALYESWAMPLPTLRVDVGGGRGKKRGVA